MQRHIAIIGSGPTAIYTAHYLRKADAGTLITVFESQAEAGRGSPYHPKWNTPSMLSNIASIEIPRLQETLLEWLGRQDEERLSRCGIVAEDLDERAFYPRVVLGQFFQAQLAQMAAASGGRMVVKAHHHVEDIHLKAQGTVLRIRTPLGIVEQAFTHVVVATGHNMPMRAEVRPGYFIGPWPTSCLSRIGQCAVGIRGTSLSGIDAVIALADARGTFYRDGHGGLRYLAEPGTEGFGMTMMSRKGLLPEADFYHSIPYKKLRYCTAGAVANLIHYVPAGELLNAVFELFKEELGRADLQYAAKVQLQALTLEKFGKAYFDERLQYAPFLWAERNLAEAKANQRYKHTVPWRYAILRMHEVIGQVVRFLPEKDHARFHKHFKPVFLDNYATVPHLSIERLLALKEAGKLSILRLGNGYQLDTHREEGGAVLTHEGKDIHFPAFIEATGQRNLSAEKFPFPGLLEQGVVGNAVARASKGKAAIEGIALDEAFHPVSDFFRASNIYCVSLPFMLAQFPFSQGISGSHDIGKIVAEDLLGESVGRELRVKEGV